MQIWLTAQIGLPDQEIRLSLYLLCAPAFTAFLGEHFVSGLRPALLAALLAFAAGVANAAAVHDYRFSFTGSIVDGSPEVVGIVRGLAEGNNAIDTVEIIFNTGGYGIGTYTHNTDAIGSLNWTVTAGVVTAWTFFSVGVRNVPPDVKDSSFAMSSNLFGSSVAGLSRLDNTVQVGSPATFEKIAPIPVPAAFSMLAAVLGGLGLAARQRRRA